ncbi:Tctex-1 [Lineolata rhizophorae]|uniref:Tctex-1 n=1 Tax=Lineolata rhizophorae TaxID=578093 RepID=A0A6A6PC47_9PEZI|nr:Tctex-1 [Lineolata rhizophorae]
MAPPVSETRLKQIATDACEAALRSAEGYVHSSTPSWNSAIINSILNSLVSETSVDGSPPKFKYVVNSTIIQLQAPPAGDPEAKAAKRGLHSAQGAFWNNDVDGNWGFQYHGAESKGIDVVIQVLWVGV